MIGIIIVNYNTWNDVILCVESITETLKNYRYKIYIIDNNSPNNSYKELVKIFQGQEDIVLHKAEKNGGYSAGNNIGIKMALKDKAEYLLITNSDIIFYNNAIEIMMRAINKDKGIGIVGPKVILPSGKIQHLIRENYTFFNYIFLKKPLKYFDFFKIEDKILHNDYDYNDRIVFNGCISGCCMLFSKEYFLTCGLMDEEMFLYYEEAVIGFNSSINNIKTCLEPNAIVLHKSSQAIGNKNSAFSRYNRYYSSLYMLKKYVKVNFLELTIAILINYIPFLTNSLTKKDYRAMLKNFSNKCLNLYKIK